MDSEFYQDWSSSSQKWGFALEIPQFSSYDYEIL